MKTTLFTLLSTRRFLPLFITQFLGAFNDNIFKSALIILLTYRISTLSNGSSPLLVTAAAGIFILPFFLFSALAGQLADRYEKSRLISIIKLIEIILMVIATLGFYFKNIYLLMTVLFALGTHAAFFGPLKYAILPEQLRENELIAGNGLIEAGTFISILLGTILGGLVILHSHGEFVISAITIATAIIGWLASLFILKTKSSQFTIHYTLFKETFQLIKYAKNFPDVFLCILGISWFWLVGAIFLSEIPIFVKDILHANENIVTLFLALFSIGLAMGSLLCNKLLKGKMNANYVPLGALGMSLFIIDLYFASAIPLVNLNQLMTTFQGWRIMLDLVFMAICGGLYTVPLYAILQYRSPKEHCARMIATNNILNALFMVVSAIATALMLKIGLSVAEIFLVIAIANGLAAIYMSKLK